MSMFFIVIFLIVVTAPRMCSSLWLCRRPNDSRHAFLCVELPFSHTYHWQTMWVIEGELYLVIEPSKFCRRDLEGECLCLCWLLGLNLSPWAHRFKAYAGKGAGNSQSAMDSRYAALKGGKTSSSVAKECVPTLSNRNLNCHLRQAYQW